MLKANYERRAARAAARQEQERLEATSKERALRSPEDARAVWAAREKLQQQQAAAAAAAKQQGAAKKG